MTRKQRETIAAAINTFTTLANELIDLLIEDAGEHSDPDTTYVDDATPITYT